MLSKAFNAILSLKQKSATLKRPGTPDLTTACKVSSSNYYRANEGPSATIAAQREYVISLSSIESPFTPVIKRGDKIVFSDWSYAITDVEELYDFGHTTIGYRVKCE